MQPKNNKLNFSFKWGTITMKLVWIKLLKWHVLVKLYFTLKYHKVYVYNLNNFLVIHLKNIEKSNIIKTT
jgi:hypothetical protein